MDGPFVEERKALVSYINKARSVLEPLAIKAPLAPECRCGQRLATGSWDRTAKIWDARSGRELLNLDAEERGLGVNTLAASPFPTA
jgi:WD40 repeat protein